MQQTAGHILDLMLGGVAVAHHGLLDLHGFVLVDGDTGLLDGKQNDTAALGDADAGGDVLTEEQLFNGHCFGLGNLQKLGHVVIDHLQPQRKVRTRRGGDGAVLQKAEIAALGIHNAEACDAVTGIDSEDPHYKPPREMLM